MKCTKCGLEEERLIKAAYRDHQTCNKCSGKMKVLISPTSFRLKGKGWAKDGYKGTKE